MSGQPIPFTIMFAKTCFTCKRSQLKKTGSTHEIVILVVWFEPGLQSSKAQTSLLNYKLKR